ncbi:MAG: 6-pyruvoyl tetrahydropterin synthase family protein [Pirellulales bacterium]|nr:6-pyruvoyl tetrahydropterin synthase family protein [Pirellulales bacterium]
MTESYCVRITKDYLVFSAGHFITFAGDMCERLHGHNYRVSAEVHGPLDENHYVVDFILLRDLLQEIVLELDHYMLLPTQHRTIRVQADERRVRVTHADREWIFPRGDCVLLDVPNTTAEMLARHIGRRLLDELARKGIARPTVTRIEVDECEGQSAVCEFRDDR